MSTDLWSVFSGQFSAIHLRGKSETTKAQYRHTLKSLQDYLQRRPTIDDLTDETISAWLAWLESQPYQGRKRSPHTIDGRREYIMSLAGWLNRRGMLRVMPEVMPLNAPMPTPKAWTKGELARLYVAACKLRGTCKGIPAAALWRSWIRLAWDTGERTGAMLALRSEWIDGNRLYVPANVRKGKKAAAYWLKDGTLLALRASGYQDRERIFPMSFPTYRDWFGRILKAAKLPDDRKSLNHRIRRSFASHLKAAGEDATEALQHTSRKVTDESYIDPRVYSPQPVNVCLWDLDAVSPAQT